MCFVSRLGGRKFRRGTNTARDGRARKAVTVMIFSTYVGIWAATVHGLTITYEHANSPGVGSYPTKKAEDAVGAMTDGRRWLRPKDRCRYRHPSRVSVCLYGVPVVIASKILGVGRGPVAKLSSV